MEGEGREVGRKKRESKQSRGVSEVCESTKFLQKQLH